MEKTPRRKRTKEVLEFLRNYFKTTGAKEATLRELNACREKPVHLTSRILRNTVCRLASLGKLIVSGEGKSHRYSFLPQDNGKVQKDFSKKSRAKREAAGQTPVTKIDGRGNNSIPLRQSSKETGLWAEGQRIVEEFPDGKRTITSTVKIYG